MNFQFQDLLGGTEEGLQRLRTQLALEYPDVPSVARSRFVMVAELANKVLLQEKCTTIRFDKNAVEYPIDTILPLYALEEGEKHDEAKRMADLALHSLRYQRVDDLTEDDALADGFRSREELIDTLESFYGALAATDIVCIYAFSLNHIGSQQHNSNTRTKFEKIVCLELEAEI
jgi:hypothetical protein